MHNQNIVDTTFFNQPPLKGAEQILGMLLCRQFPDGTISRHRITEVEAYDGPDDKACHAYKGRTPRTEVLFGPPGHWYIYLCYGIHWMLNIVTGPEGYPSALLIRSVEDITGPGRLTKILQIDQSFNTLPACPSSKLWIEQSSPLPKFSIKRTPRIGVDYAGPIWSKKPYRFLLSTKGS